jgi:hypothetical protein
VALNAGAGGVLIAVPADGGEERYLDWCAISAFGLDAFVKNSSANVDGRAAGGYIIME